MLLFVLPLSQRNRNTFTLDDGDGHHPHHQTISLSPVTYSITLPPLFPPPLHRHIRLLLPTFASPSLLLAGISRSSFPPSAIIDFRAFLILCRYAMVNYPLINASGYTKHRQLQATPEVDRKRKGMRNGDTVKI